MTAFRHRTGAWLSAGRVYRFPITLLFIATQWVFIAGAMPVYGEQATNPDEDQLTSQQPADLPPSEPQSAAQQTATQIWADGTKYIGTIVDGKREGKGIIIWPDGTRYTGFFKNNLREGAGTMLLPDGTVYKGNFVKGELVPTPDRQVKTAVPVADVSESQIPQQELYPPVTEISEAVTKSLENALTLWAAAWSDKNATQYLASYDDEFRVPGKLSREQWEILRRSRISRPSNISVSLQFQKISIIDTNLAQVELTQNYQSNLYSGTTQKTFRLKRDDHGTWLILSEDITN